MNVRIATAVLIKKMHESKGRQTTVYFEEFFGKASGIL